MRIRTLALTLTGILAVAGLVAAAFLTREIWGDWLAQRPPTSDAAQANEHDRHPKELDRVRLTPQARRNLRLVVEPLRPEVYRRTIAVPGTIVERLGKSNRGVTTPLAGVVQRMFALPGDTVRPGAELVTLSLTSEPLQTSQTELYKTAQDILLTTKQKERLEGAAKSGTIAEVRIIEVENQLARLRAIRKTYRSDLALRGLTPAQIDQAENGQFLREITIRAPARPANGGTATSATKADDPPAYEVEELKVQPGEQVQAGQTLLYLADHQSLYIEGRAFKADADLVARSAAKGWPVEVSESNQAAGDWGPIPGVPTIQHLANSIDPASQTFAFYVPLPNQYHDYTRDGKVYRVWRFRPGQKVRVGVRVEEVEGVFVLPADAIVRDGPEAYIFRQNGDTFERRPVEILFEDADRVVLRPSGSAVHTGNYVARGGAAALNRALKAQAAEHAGGGHDHHGHSH